MILGFKEIDELSKVRKSIIKDEYDSECIKTLIDLCPQLLTYSNDKVKLLVEISNIIISELQSVVCESDKQKLFFIDKIDEITKENSEWIKSYKPENIHTYNMDNVIPHTFELIENPSHEHVCDILNSVPNPNGLDNDIYYCK